MPNAPASKKGASSSSSRLGATPLVGQGMTQDQVSEYRAAFSLFDKNGDGTITAKELGVVLDNLGMNPSETELREIVNAIDLDGNGQIEFSEFLNLMQDMAATAGRKTGFGPTSMEAEETAALKEAFNVFDKDGNGHITRAEMKHALLTNLDEQLTDKELDSMFAGGDVDGDGNIDFTEFARMMRNI